MSKTHPTEKILRSFGLGMRGEAASHHDIATSSNNTAGAHRRRYICKQEGMRRRGSPQAASRMPAHSHGERPGARHPQPASLRAGTAHPDEPRRTQRLGGRTHLSSSIVRHGGGRGGRRGRLSAPGPAWLRAAAPAPGRFLRERSAASPARPPQRLPPQPAPPPASSSSQPPPPASLRSSPGNGSCEGRPHRPARPPPRSGGPR